MNNQLSALYKKYEKYFPIGTIVNEQLIELDKELIVKHFNSVTPENALKLSSLHPERNSFDFEHADQLVDFGINNSMLVRGHVLVWHDHAPEWFFIDEAGGRLPIQVLLTRLREYIHTVVKHFGDKIYCWDVVNEALADDKMFYRPSKWLESIGEQFIEYAFQYAHEANNNIKLYYNDYNIEMGEKAEKAYSLIKGLVEREIPIHGVGIQGHYDIFAHKPDELRKTIERYAKLGLMVQITEMDVSVFEFSDKERNYLQPTEEMLQKQAEFYGKAFEIFREYSSVIEGVTLWGVSDRYTWKDDFPVNGKKDWPLLFDEKGREKAAFKSIMSF